jgi:hypothetical protein
MLQLLKLVLLNNYFYLLPILNVSYLETNEFFFLIIFNINLVRSNSPLVKNFKLTTSQEDFEFKKLLFNTVVVLSRNPVMNEV